MTAICAQLPLNVVRDPLRDQVRRLDPGFAQHRAVKARPTGPMRNLAGQGNPRSVGLAEDQLLGGTAIGIVIPV